MMSATGSRRLSRGTVRSFLTIVCLVQASIALADPLMNLTFDEEYWMMAPTSDPENGDPRPVLGYVSESSSKFSEIVIDIGTPYRTWLHSEISPQPDSSLCPPACAIKRTALGFQITPSVALGSHKKDKVQLSIEDRAETAKTHIPFGEVDETRAYVAFDLMLDPTYSAAESDEFVIHFQLVQGGGHPIFTMQGEKHPDSVNDVDLVFYTTNDATEDAFRCALTSPTYHEEFYRLPMPKGIWKTIVVQFIPPYVTNLSGGACGRADGCGQVAVFLDHSTTLVDRFQGRWGFELDRDPACAEEEKSAPALPFAAAGLGIYRSPQQATQTIYFDNVKFGTTFSSVNTQ